MTAEPEHLGSGMYGCVVRPPPACRAGAGAGAGAAGAEAAGDGSDLAGRVAKLTPSIGDAAHELWIGNRVREVDPQSAYTLLPDPVWCEVDARDLGPDTCTSLVVDPARPVLYRLVMDYGGTVIADTLPTRDAVRAMRSCIMGLRDLAAYGICHRDLHSNNLLVTTSDAGEQTIRIIDFGLGIITENTDLLGDDLTLLMDVFEAWLQDGLRIWQTPPDERHVPEDMDPNAARREAKLWAFADEHPGEEPWFSAPAQEKLQTLMTTLHVPGAAHGVFNMLPQIWDDIWDDDITLARYAGLVTPLNWTGADPAPLEDMYMYVHQTIVNTNPLWSTARHADDLPPPIPSSQPVLQAWYNLVLEGSRGGNPFADNLLGAIALVQPYNLHPALLNATNFWQAMAWLAPIQVALGVLSSGDGSDPDMSKVSEEAVTDVITALQSFRRAHRSELRDEGAMTFSEWSDLLRTWSGLLPAPMTRVIREVLLELSGRPGPASARARPAAAKPGAKPGVKPGVKPGARLGAARPKP